MSRRHPNLTIILTLALLLVAPSPILATASTDERYFPATGHSVVGKFFAYWDAHGGLAQFGYPISDEFAEVSAVDGKSYGVQYFERAVFEYHPENQPPYDVELAQLGTLRYQQIYPNGANNQQANADHPYTFAATGKTIGGAFRTYWEQHGGLAQFGYPISDQFYEISPVDDMTYKVQYFERAEFELHPEPNLKYSVQASLLGRFRYNGKYHQDVYTPSVITAYVSNPASNVYSSISNPIVAGHYVFWMAPEIGSIYCFDLNTQTEFIVVKNIRYPAEFASNGKIVVWIDGTHINAFDLKTGSSYTLATEQDLHTALALDANTLYYATFTKEYALDLTTGQRQLIHTPGDNYVVKDGILLWSELIKDCMYCPLADQLHLMSLTEGITDTLVITSPDNVDYSGYGVAGDNVVWSYDLSSYIPHYPDIVKEYKGVYLYSISAGKTQMISSDIAYNPIISGQRVLWTSGGAIKEYDVGSGTTTTPVPFRADNNRAIGIVNQNTLIYSRTIPTQDGLITTLYSVNIP